MKGFPHWTVNQTIFLQPCPVVHELFTILYSSSKKLKPSRHCNVCGFLTLFSMRNTMFQHPECSACIWITEGPSMRHLLTFRMFFQGTHFWAFCRLASSCPALTLAREGGQLWVRHRIYNYKQRTAMSYTNDIMKHQKHSETLSSQLQCSGSKVWTYLTPLAIYQLLTNLQHCSPCKRSLNATPREHISCQLATMLPGSSEKMWKAMPWNESNSIQVAMLRCTVQHSKIRAFRARVVFQKPPNSKLDLARIRNSPTDFTGLENCAKLRIPSGTCCSCVRPTGSDDAAQQFENRWQ